MPAENNISVYYLQNETRAQHVFCSFAAQYAGNTKANYDLWVYIARASSSRSSFVQKVRYYYYYDGDYCNGSSQGGTNPPCVITWRAERSPSGAWGAFPLSKFVTRRGASISKQGLFQFIRGVIVEPIPICLFAKGSSRRAQKQLNRSRVMWAVYLYYYI
jgi:hypothetical protein